MLLVLALDMGGREKTYAAMWRKYECKKWSKKLRSLHLNNEDMMVMEVQQTLSNTTLNLS